MTLISAVNLVLNNFGDKTSILYFDKNESMSISYEDVKLAIEIVKLKLSVNSDYPFEFIAVCTHLNFLYPVCICGILFSGRPFVCIDITSPFTWNQNLVSQLGITTILSTEKCSVKLTQILTSLVCDDSFDVLGLKLQIWKTGFLGYKNNPSKSLFLYAMQTSGSTGVPKVVCVPESCILPNIEQLRNEFKITHEDVILSASPFTFDPSIVELFLAFTSGATLFMVSNEIKANPSIYLDTLFPSNKPGITVLQMTPSVFRRWSSEDIKKKILSSESKLKVLALGGEQFPQRHYFKCCQSDENKTKIYSLYGTTEVSCWAMMSKEQNEYLGSAMAETVVQVRDEGGNIITEGTGELFIGSSSRICILDNETALNTEESVFRPTGDLVHVTQNKYKYLGRKDNTIKRWGHKVSLDEIAATALEYEGVYAAYCILDKKERLVLFVNNKNDLQTFLRHRLKEASVPDVILEMASFPLSKHGKIDKSVLESMATDHFELESKMKNTCQLEYFKMLWERYTNRSCDSTFGFLDSGGNSISALQIATELSFRFIKTSTDLLTLLLKNGNIKKCCDLLQDLNSENSKVNMSKRKHSLNVNQETRSKMLKPVEKCEIFVQCRGQCYGTIVDTVLYKELDQISLQIAWEYNLGKCVDASPTLIHFTNSKLSLVSVGSHSGKLATFDLHDGKRMWELTLPNRIESSVRPTKDGKFGIVGCYDGNIYCIQLTTGKISWSVETAAMVKCTPLVFGDSAFIGSYDHHVYCINTENGTVTWAYKTSASIFSSPLYNERYKLILVSNLGGCIDALKPDTGSLFWNLTLENPIFATPVIISWEPEDHLVLAEVNGVLRCVSLADKRQIWSFKANGNIFSSLTSQRYSKYFHVMFGCHDHNIYCIKASETSVELVWKTDVGSPVYSTPAISTSLSFLVAASTKGSIFILDVTSGEIKCNYTFPGECFCSPIVFESKIVVGCRDNIIYCLKINA